MESIYLPIDYLIKKTRNKLRIITLGKGIFLHLAYFILLISLICSADYLFSFPVQIRRVVLLTLIIFSLWLFMKVIFIPYKKIGDDKEIAFYIQRRYPELKDDLINAIELFPSLMEKDINVSSCLIKAHIEKTKDEIENVKLENIGNKNNLKRNFLIFLISIFICILVFGKGPHIFFTSLSRLLLPVNYKMINQYLEVFPGNSEVLYGTNQDVKVKIKEDIKPYLKYRKGKTKWRKTKMEREKENYFLYQFSQVKEQIDYYIQWKDLSTPIYQIKVVSLPQIGDITLKYFYPAYTNQPCQLVKNTSGDIEALMGTEVQIMCYVDKKIKEAYLLTGDGKKLSMEIKKGGNKLCGNLVLTGEKRYAIRIKDSDNYENFNDPWYSIVTVSDELPEISILAPAIDMIVSCDSEFKFVYEIKDDFGISEVYLIYSKGEESSRRLLKKFSSPEKRKILDYEWKLKELNLKPQDLISYYLEVFDNDTILGPKIGISQTYYLEVFSYEKEHEEIKLLEEHFRNQLLQILGDQIENHESLRSSLSKDDVLSEKDRDIAKIEENQVKIREDTTYLIDFLGKLLPRMEEDLLSDFQAYLEYSNMKKNLDYLNKNEMKDTVGELKQRNLQSAYELQERIITELEKMSLLSQDLLQYQKMKDLLSSTQELLDSQMDFTRFLEEIKDKKGEWDKLVEKLKMISNMMKEVQGVLSQLPARLPEEFINEEGVKKIDFGEINDLMRKLEESIMEGNLDNALLYANNLCSMMSQMMDVMRMATNNVPFATGDSLDILSKKIEECRQELEELIKEEEDILSQTTQIDKLRLEALLEKQKDILKGLAKLQEVIIKQTKDLALEVKENLKKSQEVSFFITRLNQSLLWMEEIRKELATLQVHRSKDLLKKILSFFEKGEKDFQDLNEQAIKNVTNEKTPLKDRNLWKEEERNIKEIIFKIRDIKFKEQAIADALNLKGKEIHFNQEEKEKLQTLSKMQEEVYFKGNRLQRKLDNLSRETATLGPQVTNNMGKASFSMKNTLNNLKEEDTHKAKQSEQEALYYLDQVREGLKSAQRQIGKMKQNCGVSTIGFLKPRHLRSGGRKGVRQGYVKIPSREDYQVPQEFRQDIMEALKEDYPKIYERLIKEYYKRLIEQ